MEAVQLRVELEWNRMTGEHGAHYSEIQPENPARRMAERKTKRIKYVKWVVCGLPVVRCLYLLLYPGGGFSIKTRRKKQVLKVVCM